jgi:CheY-like chemotaxis protein
MKKILIVEDTELNLDLLIQLLEDRYAIVTATTGETGVALTHSERPDLILMDMSLPVMDGWTAANKIKESVALNPIPIVGLSAHAMEADRQRALDNGCDAYLTKPIDETMLLETLERLLGD